MTTLERIQNGGVMTHWNYFATFWREQQEFSEKAYGPRSARGPVGPLKHLAKEVCCELLDVPREFFDKMIREFASDSEEIASQINLEEFVDCMFLIVDAAWRKGFTSDQFITKLFEKLEKNKARTWPKGGDPNEPVEHDRSKD